MKTNLSNMNLTGSSSFYELDSNYVSVTLILIWSLKILEMINKMINLDRYEEVQSRSDISEEVTPEQVESRLFLAPFTNFPGRYLKVSHLFTGLSFNCLCSHVFTVQTDQPLTFCKKNSFSESAWDFPPFPSKPALRALFLDEWCFDSTESVCRV